MGVEALSTSRRSARANKSALMESGLNEAQGKSNMLVNWGCVPHQQFSSASPLQKSKALLGPASKHSQSFTHFSYYPFGHKFLLYLFL